ncbi:MAG: DNA alkylation repair protein [Candidatus Bathyarchaeota archaeon]
MSHEIVSEIKGEMRGIGNPCRRKRVKSYFRETIKTHGLTSAQEKELAKKYYTRVKGELQTTIEVVDELIESGVLDEAQVGIRLLRRMANRLTPNHFEILDGWVGHLTNWANTDSLGTWIISEVLDKDPNLVESLLGWTSSESRWRRRAAAVSLVPIARKGEMLEEIFRVADRLMTDEDDMVQKGVGWLLKEASKNHPNEIRSYLLRWREEASALILRYASEKLPSEMRVLKTKH